LNVLFFDEQFNFIPQDINAPNVGSNLEQVSSPNDQNAPALTLTQKAPKNGWVYIYLSNESNQPVYFDNLSVSQVHGNISEENHYYAFGQKITGISTLAFNKLKTQYRYQGDYSEEEENTSWNEFALRMYDRQLGRWTGVDPDDQFASPYTGMGNDPINNTDPTGGDIDDEVAGIAEFFSGGDPGIVNLKIVQDFWVNGTFMKESTPATAGEAQIRL
jgi:RHS repeat-associated protein